MSNNNKFLTILSGIKTLVNAISSSAGVADANKIISTTDTGKIDISLLPQTTGLALSGSIGFRLYEEFLYGTGTFSIHVGGTGSSCSPVNTNAIDNGNHPGICQLSTGTTATGFARLGGVNGDNLNRILLGYALWETEVLVSLVTLRNTTDEYIVHIGFSDSYTTGAIADGIIFFYSSTSIYWQIRTISNSVNTNFVTNVEVTANSWYKLKIKVNATADNADFYINDQYITSITTNIPKGTGRQTLYSASIVKSAGTSNRQFLLDYVDIVCLFSAAR